MEISWSISAELFGFLCGVKSVEVFDFGSFRPGRDAGADLHMSTFIEFVVRYGLS